MSNLQPWAQAELRRQGVQNLAKAIIAADRLVDFKANCIAVEKKKDKKDQANGGNFKMKKKTFISETNEGGKTQINKDKPSTSGTKSSGCFIC